MKYKVKKDAVEIADRIYRELSIGESNCGDGHDFKCYTADLRVVYGEKATDYLALQVNVPTVKLNNGCYVYAECLEECIKVKADKDLKRKLKIPNLWKQFKKNAQDENATYKIISVNHAFFYGVTKEGVFFWEMVAREVDRLK